MGRKKRKSVTEENVEDPSQEGAPPAAPAEAKEEVESSNLRNPAPASLQPTVVDSGNGSSKDAKASTSSAYALTSHSGEIIDEDIYVSDGSSDEDEDEVEMVLAGSRMGMMRRGIHHSMLVQPKRQWVRQDPEADGDETKEDAEQKRLKAQEEELAKLDPAQRAARLLAEKQRKLEEAKETARRLESEENAGRDPCLFSKRTAFDIRMDQIDDKPWVRGAGEVTDFFNYGLTEEDWLDYSQQQLMIRQELTDANRQRRPPDPNVVPVTPRAPNKQTPKVAVAVSSKSDDDGDESTSEDEVAGPVLVKKEETEAKVEKSEGPNKDSGFNLEFTGAGGAWGAGAAPGSMLARLIEEQEAKEETADKGKDSSAPNSQMHRGRDVPADNYYGQQPTMDGGGQDHRDWKQQEDWGGHNKPNHQEWNSHHGGQDWGYQNQSQPDWNHRGHRGGRAPPPPPFGGGGGRGGGRGGRGYMHGGRGGRGPPGRGFPPPPPPGNNPHWGGRGDFGNHQGRKRGRDDYDNRRRR